MGQKKFGIQDPGIPLFCDYDSNAAKLGIIRNVSQSQCDRHKRDQSLFELNILIRQVIRFPIFATQLVPTSPRTAERSNLEKPDQEKPGLLNCLGELSEAFSCWLLSHNEIVCVFLDERE